MNYLNGYHPAPEICPPLDVAIIGAGASGVGIGVALKRFGVENFALLERENVGAAFEKWPAEMRFITPSFPSNPFGCPDLNAVAPEISVAVDVGREHPSGPQYAAHLRNVVASFELPVQNGIEVRGLQAEENQDDGPFFRLQTTQGTMCARFVVWAAGEFSTPREHLFPGAELCMHNSRIEAYGALQGDEFVVVGGYESGIDAAVHLAGHGKRVRVFDSHAIRCALGFDPSVTLSPYTRERLEGALESGLVELCDNTKIARVEKNGAVFCVVADDGRAFFSSSAPILATGFESSLQAIAPLFEWNSRGDAELSENDESVKTRGLFVCGPSLRHLDAQGEALIFCFIYKFRGRFPIVAQTIAARLGLEIEDGINWYLAGNMYLDDLSCCGDACGC